MTECYPRCPNCVTVSNPLSLGITIMVLVGTVAPHFDCRAVVRGDLRRLRWPQIQANKALVLLFDARPAPPGRRPRRTGSSNRAIPSAAGSGGAGGGRRAPPRVGDPGLVDLSAQAGRAGRPRLSAAAGPRWLPRLAVRLGPRRRPNAMGPIHSRCCWRRCDRRSSVVFLFPLTWRNCSPPSPCWATTVVPEEPRLHEVRNPVSVSHTTGVSAL